MPDNATHEEREAHRILSGSVPQRDVTLYGAIKGGFQEKDKVWLDRIIKAFLNKYQRIYKIGKRAASARQRADQRLAIREMANVSAHSAALMVDRASAFTSAMLQFGGISHVDGITMVDETPLVNDAPDAVVGIDRRGNLIHENVSTPGLYDGAGGLIPIIQALGAKGLVPKFFDYARALRAYRVRSQGIPFELGEGGSRASMDRAISVGLGLAKKHPEIAVAHRNLQNWNDSIVTFLEQTGVITPELAANWKGTSDYIPFYLEMGGGGLNALKRVFSDELSDIEGFNVIDRLIVEDIPSRRITGTTKPVPLMDPIEAISKNALALVVAGLKNVATGRAVRDANDVGLAQRARKDTKGRWIGDVVVVRRNGVEEHWEIADRLLHDTLVGVFDGKNKSWQMAEKIVGAPARWLRETVTRSPEFMVANMLRDSLAVWGMAGGPKVPIAGSFARAFRNVAGLGSRRAEAGPASGDHGMTTDTYKILNRGAAVGGFEMAGTDPRKLKRMFAAASGQKSLTDNLFRIWDAFGEVSAISEAATRELVYEETYKDVYRKLETQYPGAQNLERRQRIAEGEAIFQAMEILNFSRRGSNPLVQLTAAAIPFLNARFQGMARLSRVAFQGEGIGNKSEREVKMQFLQRMLFLSGVSFLYAWGNQDDEDYWNIEPEIRDDNWLFKLPTIPGKVPRYIAFPIPFEVGVFGAKIPEALARLLMSGNTREFSRAIKHSLMSTLQLNPMPQIVRPVWEAASNYDPYRNAQVVPEHIKKLGGYGYRPGTTGIARAIGAATAQSPDWVPGIGGGISPLKVDHVLRGYLSQWGMATADIIDLGFNAATGRNTPGLRWYDLPLFNRFVRGPGGYKDAYYNDLAPLPERAYAITRQKAKTDPEGAREFARENAPALRLRGLSNQYKRKLSQIRDVRNAYLAAGLRGEVGPGQLTEVMERLEYQEFLLLRNIPLIMKMVD